MQAVRILDQVGWGPDGVKVLAMIHDMACKVENEAEALVGPTPSPSLCGPQTDMPAQPLTSSHSTPSPTNSNMPLLFLCPKAW